jgi:uncharacterized protein
MKYAYLHGFNSGPSSKKGSSLAKVYHEQGVELLLPDLNQPSFSKLTFTTAMKVIDEMDEIHAKKDGEKWCLIGSSLGGYLTALWTIQNPERVDRVFLLCPAFKLIERWSKVLRKERLEKWQTDGFLDFPNANGKMTPLHWGFVEDAKKYPQMPIVPCSAFIVHGQKDETVPIEFSREYSNQNSHVQLLEVDDNHSLMGSLPILATESMRFFGLP